MRDVVSLCLLICCEDFSVADETKMSHLLNETRHKNFAKRIQGRL
jgi:hypothetical protein